MTAYIQFPTADGAQILIEVNAEDDRVADLVDAGLGEKVERTVVRVRDCFEATMMETVRRNAESFIGMMNGLSNPPDEAEVTFGVNAAAEAGYSAIAKASADASYTVKLVWKRDQSGRE